MEHQEGVVGEWDKEEITWFIGRGGVSERRGDRPGSRNVVVLITDWLMVTRQDQLLFEAASARAAGIQVSARNPKHARQGACSQGATCTH